MSRIGLFWHAPVDVLSADDPEPATPAVVVPEVGLRWGAPSPFEHGLPAAVAPDETPGIVINQGRSRVFRGTEVHREFGEEVPAGARPVESIKRVTFYLGAHEEVHEQRTIQGNVTTVEPIVETVREYIEFDFAFTMAGARGEPPPPAVAPPRPSPGIAEVTDLGTFRTIVKFDTEDPDSGPGGHYDIVVNFGSSGGTEGPTRAAYEEALEFFDLVEANNPDVDYVRAIIPPHQLPDGSWAYSAQLLVWVPD